LAHSINAQRPAVSRSLKILRQQGLIQRDKEGWKVTNAGATEAGDALSRLGAALQAAQKVRDSFDWKLSALGLGERFALDTAWMEEAIRPSLDAIMGFERVYQSLAPPDAVAGQVAGWAVSDQLTRPFAEAMQPLLDAAAQGTSLLAEIVSSKASLAGVADIIARNNALVAGALENVQALSVATQIRDLALDQILYAGVADHVRDVTAAYGGLLEWQTSLVAPIPLQLSPDIAWRDITVPTVTVSSYTRSLRWGVHREGDDLPALEQLDFEEGAGNQLDDLLGTLDPRFVDMRHGSWQALHSNNPDRGRHAAVSYRELVRQLLALLVPEAMVSGDLPGSKMKGAVTRLLGGSESSAEFAVALSDAVYQLYSYLSKPVHTGYGHLQAVRAALLSGEGLLLFLLVHRSSSQAERPPA